MKGISILKSMIVSNKNRLIVTYLLFTLEMAGGLLKPFFLGEAVNDLLQGGYWWLLFFLLVHLAWLLVGSLRMLYDTRTYTTIYNKLITEFLHRHGPTENVSKLSAVSTLSREYTDFLEYDLIYILEALYNIVGSLIFIYFYNAKILIPCLIVLVPIVLLSQFYGRRMGKLTQLKNDELEKQVEVIGTFDRGKIDEHYKLLQKWQIKISDQQAFNFGIMEILVMGLLGTSLLLSTRFTAFPLNAGQIIGFYFYIMKFTAGLDTIPYMTEKYASLKDITSRLEAADTALEE